MSSAPLTDSVERRRYSERPLLGVGALIFDGPRILLIERGKEPLKGQWTLPGGLVEMGETLDSAVRREIMEETGLVIEPGPVVTLFERIMPDEDGRTEFHYVIVDYICEATGGALQAGSDVAKAEWVDLADLSRYEITPGTFGVIEKALGMRK